MTQPISNSIHTHFITPPPAAEDASVDRAQPGPVGTDAFAQVASTSAAAGRAAVLTAIDPVRDAWDGAIDVGEAIGGLSSGLRFAEIFGGDPSTDRLRVLSADERLDLAKRGAVTLTTAFVTASARGVVRVADLAADFAQAFTDTVRAEPSPGSDR
jgi:hypothetical protein